MKDFENIYSQAYELFSRKKFAESLLKLAEAEMFIADSSSGELLISIENLKGFNYIGLDQKETARECFLNALNINSSSSQACAGLAELFYLESKDTEAKQMYEWAVKNDSKNIFAVKGLAKVNEILGFEKEHNSLVAEVSHNGYSFNDNIKMKNEKISENEINLLLISAGKLMESGGFAEAEKEIVEIQKKIEDEISLLNESLSEVMNLRGLALLKLDKIEEAREAFEKALNINPGSSDAYHGLADILFLSGRYNESKSMYEWAIKNNTENISARNSLIKVNKELGLSENHNSLVTEEVKPGKQENIFDNVLAEAYSLFKNKNFEAAIKKLSDIERTFEIESKDIVYSLENFRGFNFLGLNNIEEARLSFEKALNLNPSSSQACAGLGEIFFIEKKDKEAKAMFEWAVKNNQQNQFAISGLKKVNKLLNLPLVDNSLLKPMLTLSSGKKVYIQNFME